MEADGALLIMDHITKRFRMPDRKGWIDACVDFSLSVGHRETVALVGESGSGKSTVARLALGLIRPDAGEVILCGRRLSQLSSRELRNVRVGMQPIFQDPVGSFNPRRTIGAALNQALHQRGITRGLLEPRAVELLERVGLRPGQEFLQRYPHEVSGGQRQRVAIARALAMEPYLLIADEPLSGADVSIQGQILNLLLQLRDERAMSYLLITHDISLARDFADRVVVMRGGRVVETGVASEVLAHPRHEYTKLLLDSVPGLPATGAVGVRFARRGNEN